VRRRTRSPAVAYSARKAGIIGHEVSKAAPGARKDLGPDTAWARTASLGNRALRWL